MSERPRIAIFDFAGCEGCQLQLANLGELLLEVFGRVELVECRELLSERWDGRYPIAVVEGSITSTEAEVRLRRLRARSDKLIALGACATLGGVNGIVNRRPLTEARKRVYGAADRHLDSIPVRALHQVVPVDYFVHGCPIYPEEFLRVLKAALAGVSYPVPDVAVCVECRFNENVCLYEQGIACLGPVTRGGCNAWCINHGNLCYGCRGLVSNPNRSGAEAVLRRYGLDAARIADRLTLYGTPLEAGHD